MSWGDTEVYEVLVLADASESAEEGQVVFSAIVDPRMEFGDMSEVTVHALRDKALDLSSTEWQLGTAKVTVPEPGLLIGVVSLHEGIVADQHQQALFQIPIEMPEKAYHGVCFGVASFAITLKTIKTDEFMDPVALVDSSTLWHDGYAMEYEILDQLAMEVHIVADEMRGQMVDPAIEEGKFAGSSLFDAMEAAEPFDVGDFLLFITAYPLSYRGKTWSFAEIYGTWLMNGTPERQEAWAPSTEGQAGIGAQLEADPSTGYIRVTAISGLAHGNPEAIALANADTSNEVLAVGDLILAVDGESTFRKSVEEVEEWLLDEPFSHAGIDAFSMDHRKKWVAVMQMVLPEDPLWVYLDVPIPQPLRLFPTRIADKYGFIDAVGRTVVQPKFDGFQGANIGGSLTFSHGLAPIEVEDVWGFINLEGTVVIPPQWPTVDDFQEGVAAVFAGGRFDGFHKMSFIDTMGNEVIPPTYYDPGMYADFSEGLAQVRTDANNYQRVGFIDKSGELVIPCEWYLPNKFKEGLCATQTEEDGKYGYIDKTGSWVLEPQYDKTEDFSDGVAVVQKGDTHYVIDKRGTTVATLEARPWPRPFRYDRLKAVKDGKYGYFDRSWEIVIPCQYVDARPFYGGLAAVTLTGEKEEDGPFVLGGWHFISPDGETVIPGPFEDVRWFADGVCWVVVDGLWGLIDTTGDWLILPEYDNQDDRFNFGEFMYGISQVAIRRPGEFLPETYFMYIDKQGDIVWQPEE